MLEVHDAFRTVVDCGRLADIPRGRVEVTTTTFLSTATYVCDSGFSIEGTSVRTCLATGVWSGREPTCTREYSSYTPTTISKSASHQAYYY